LEAEGKQVNAEESAHNPNVAASANKFSAVKLRLLLGLSVLWLAPTLACGSFAPRPTPTPSPVAQPTDLAVSAETPTANATPLLVVDNSPVLPAGSITGTTATTGTQGVTIATPAPVPTAAANVLAPGNQARVVAPGGLNMRAAATTGGNLIIQLATGGVVTILEGPIQADGYTWWRIDDGAGNVGWAVQGDGTTEFLSPSAGGAAQAVDRSPTVGERVVINSQVSVRSLPSTTANLLTYADQGAQFSVLAGPQTADGFTWYQIRSDDGTIEGWAAEGDGTTRWISPLE
jgi:hypothetical protein